MKYLTIAFSICISIAIASAQFFGPQFDSTGSYSGFGGSNSLSGDFGGPSAFGGARDSRQDRGPVVFPPPPNDAPVESSGVVVGASGYGFVPPQNQFQNSLPYTFPSINRFNSRYFQRFNFF